MRQVFFLVAAAMFIAFSLSWASPASSEIYFATPDQVILPASLSLNEVPEVSASLTLRDSCESIEGVDQQVLGHRIIFSVRLQHKNNHLCDQQIRSQVGLNFDIENFSYDSSGRLDVYFREDEDSLKYFGSIEWQGKPSNRGELYHHAAL